jgi:hypothetical protein
MKIANQDLCSLFRRLREVGETVLPPSQARCLLAIIQIHHDTGIACTLRDVADKLGIHLNALRCGTSIGGGPLQNLRRLGLIDWQEGKAHSIRPLVRIELMTSATLGPPP